MFDIGEEIEAAKIELRAAKRKKERLLRHSGPGDIHSDTSYVDADAIKSDHHKEAMTEIQELMLVDMEIRHLENYIGELEKDIDKIKRCVKSMQQTDKKVVYLRDVCNMGLKDIAKVLNFTYGYIKKISMKNPKE